MRVLTFNLSGDLACFKQATSFDMSTELILTYDIIPITVLKGIIGAVLGYKGLADAYKNHRQPEYIDKLKNVGIGIQPVRLGTKFTQQITNTTGFANEGALPKTTVGIGQTAIIKQEILADISYDIYLTDEFDDFDKLYHKLMSKQTAFPIVLGRKGFSAQISNVQCLDTTIVKGFSGNLNSIGLYNLVQTNKNTLFSTQRETYQYILELPVTYNDLMMYEFEPVYYSDANITYDGEVLKDTAIAIIR
ncbi:CRISPR-associated protein Cas5 [Vagococcus humatus]|uniref:Type I-B CRISPR-associated protein Cas5 n=1 Tax=Vagococcus humatus TaxID=1889241 RepID=A0A429Z9A5_9ENTE|nr:CRISPR-associated protein Cas5 [Vagococcus humatus]RST90281.1 hypothetical protein C7P63_04185 [Vagococcus humatus]